MYENRVYETDGEKAIGIHELGAIALLAPVGRPLAARIFDSYLGADGSRRLAYEFVNPARIVGPAAEVALPDWATDLDVEVRVCCAISDAGEQIDRTEAPGFILGFAIETLFVAPTELAEARAAAMPQAQAKDIGVAMGPYLSTPDDLTDYLVEPKGAAYRWSYTVTVNDQEVASGVAEPEESFADLLGMASRNGAVHAGEVIAGLPLPIPPLASTCLGRGLLAGDRIDVAIEGLGVLVTRIV